MARIVATLRYEHRGLDECLASFASAAEASAHAHCELIELDFADGAIRFQGNALVSMEMRIEGNVVIGEVKPTAAMILFAAWFMNALPARATVTWKDGWPTFYVPPNDDRETGDDPKPPAPNELVPA
ncbi:MAG TPA: hypothetical protein PKD48_01905 [Sphingopyxis sp.]|nr:hypothetical protein [Sphingopyxis sp.]